MTALTRALTLVALSLFVSACSDRSGSDTRSAEILSRELRPADSELAAIYGRSCRSCHTVAATGSPLTGDAEAWAIRMDKDMNVLLDNVINGYGGMPPFGLCMDCDTAQFEALIRFMAKPGIAP